jgi:hypothetical protein
MIAPPVFLDANIFMYAAGAVHPYKEPCVGILSSLEMARFAYVRRRPLMPGRARDKTG